MMTQAKTQTLMLGVSVEQMITSAKEQLRGRLHGAGGDRGSQTLEWAIIAAIVVGLCAIVAVKITAAVNTHAALIK
jgi:hypothetical protein